MSSPPKRFDRSNALVVNSATFLLWVVFRLLECLLFLPSIMVRRTSAKRRRWAPEKPSRTAVVVGGSFAGLAALRELVAWRAKDKDRNNDGEGLRVVLIDRRDYSEYVPGILRLFVDPGHFFDLAQKLPGSGNDGRDGGVAFERIVGTVTSIVAHEPVEERTGANDASPERRNGRTKPKRTLTYLPASDKNRTAGSNTERNAQGRTSTKHLDYDYLILATGATYYAPISPAPPKAAGTPSASSATTLLDRYQEWWKAHARLRCADRVLILGGGAVGVELAAEILDDERTGGGAKVAIVDAQPTLVPLFPRSVGAYAEDWLSQRGAELHLGQSLTSWDDNGCTLSDGTVLKADVVYVCFGNKPNSEMVRPSPSAATRTKSLRGATETGSSESNGNKLLFSLTKRRTVAVKDTLQLVVNNGTDGDDDDDADTDAPWFACGDVASPPTNDEKQAFQAEMQGKLAGKNVIKLLESSQGTSQRKPRLLRYPRDVAGADRIPLVFVLSLGQHDGVLGFNDMVIPGPLAAVVKWILEYTKVSQMRGRPLGNLVWKVGDAATLFLSRTLLRSSPKSPSTASARTDGSKSGPVRTD